MQYFVELPMRAWALPLYSLIHQTEHRYPSANYLHTYTVQECLQQASMNDWPNTPADYPYLIVLNENRAKMVVSSQQSIKRYMSSFLGRSKSPLSQPNSSREL